MSLVSQKPSPTAPVRTTSSLITVLNRKSRMPAPPNSSGAAKPT